MKCPKCNYLGFEHVERCRNCGYDFLLSSSVGLPELAIRQPASEPDPLGDLELVDRSKRIDTGDFASEMDRDLDRVLSATAPFAAEPAPGAAARSVAAPVAGPGPPPPAPAAVVQFRPAAASAASVATSAAASRLPLFSSASSDDAPLITRASPPRQPLAVRRATPEQVRLRTEAARAPALELPLDLGQPEPPVVAQRAAAPATRTGARGPGAPARAQAEGELATPGERITAVLIDLFILATIDAAIVYFTMQICAVSLSELAIVPKAPMLAFLLVQNGGYLIAFTVGGQTLGKMAAGIKVVSTGSDANLDVGHAVLRTLLWVVLAIPAGLGFISAFFSSDHRGLHDRFAGTRVVRASA